MAPAPDDNDLFRAFRVRGDSAALAALFDRQAPRLLLLAAHFARDAAEAEDLVQTTFLHALKDANSFDEARPVGAWLAGILRHRALDALRRHERRPEAELTPEHETLAESAAGPLELAERSDLFESVVAAIDTTGEPFREVLLLRLVHGLEPTVIAHTLGRAPGTVRMQLKRGLERLREVLPASLAVALATFALDGRGLAAVRETVLASASAPAAATTAVAAHAVAVQSAATPLALVVVMKNWIAVAAVVLVSAGLWFALDEREAEQVETQARAAEVAEPEDATAPAPLLADSDTAVASEPLPDARAALVAEDVRPSLVVCVLEAESATPRVGFGIEVAPQGGGAILHATTDENGEASFEDGLANGGHTVAIDRVRGVREVDVDGPTRFEWRVDAGVSVSGRVLTLAEEPAAHARIWRLDAERPNLQVEVARCDARGTFAVDGLEEDVELFATLAGHQRSEPDRAKDGDVMRLVLGARGHRVSGRVTDTHGAPAPYARLVFASDEDAREDWRGSNASPATNGRAKALDLEGSIAVADAEGRFSFDGVPAGFVLVVARAADPLSPLVGHAASQVAFGGEAYVEVVLEPGARLFGHVRTEAGAPVSNALVAAEWEGNDELGQLEDDVGALLGNARAMLTDADGAYELVGLLPGEHDVLLLSSAGDEWARFDLTLEHGEEQAWSPIVAGAHEQRMRITAHDGTPLAGFEAYVVRDTPSTLAGRVSGGSPSAADGRLVLHGLVAGESFGVELRSWQRDTLRIERRGLVATTDEIAIVLEPHEFSRAVLRGRVGLALYLDLMHVESGVVRHTRSSSDGAFEFTEIAAGEHRLVTAGNGFPAGEELARVTLLVDEQRDLGELALPAFGRVRLEVACTDSRPVAIARAELWASDGASAGTFRNSPDGWLSTPVRPGRHTLRVEPLDAAPFTTEIEVLDVAIHPVSLAIPRGQPLLLVIAPYTQSPGLPESVDVRIKAADGSDLVRREFERDDDATEFEITVHLPPGTVRVDVRDASPARRGTFEAEVEVASDGAELTVALD